MSERPSTGDFITFQFVWQLAEQIDVLHNLHELGANREERRRLFRMVGRETARTKEEVIADLSSASEACDEVEARRCFLGLPKKMRWFAQEDIKAKVREEGAQFYSMAACQAQFVRWFSGKRYGIALDHDIVSVLGEIDVDLSGLNIELPWSPMLINAGDAEFFMWAKNGVPHFMRFQRMEDGSLCIYKGDGRNPQVSPVEHDKQALAAWLCAVSKGEGKDSYFELKVGGATVALLPRINASTLVLKHKIAADSEAERGSWVRKGHFRMTKEGPVWVGGSVCRKELPFVRKVHELKPKGMLPKKQELFGGRS